MKHRRRCAGAGLLLVVALLTLMLTRDGQAQARHQAGGQTPPAAFTESVSLEAFPAWLHRQVNGLQWHTYTRQTTLTRDILQASLRLGRQFLLNNQKPEGNFRYRYDFIKKRMARGDNQVRQAGVLWGLATMYHYQPDAATRAALDRGLAFFFAHTREAPADGTLLIAYPGATHCYTGTVALVALAIIEYLRTDQAGKVTLTEDYRAWLAYMLRGYIAYLTFMRLENKHFSRALALRSHTRSPNYSPYFDGEAMLSLIKAAKYLGATHLIPLIEESALVMAKAYTIDQWRHDPDSNQTKGFFQWSCMAFWEYQDAGWKQAELFGDYVLSLAWWMLHTHHTLRRRRNTAYAYEGIIHAYRLARSRQHQAALHDLTHTIDLGLAKLTSWQVGGPLQSRNPFLTAHPTTDPLALGGVMNHKREAPLRIDVVQHQMHAVILALQYVYTPSPPGRQPAPPSLHPQP